MPLRQSCELCRSHKVKCSWPAGSDICGHCLRKKQPCRRQAKTRSRKRLEQHSITWVPPLLSCSKPSELGKAASKHAQDQAVRAGQLSSTAAEEAHACTSINLVVEAHDEALNHAIVLGDNSGEAVHDAANMPSHIDILTYQAHRTPTISHPEDPVSLDTPVFPTESTSDQYFLPPADEASILLKDFLHDFNSKIPLIAPQKITAQVSDCYSGAASDVPLAWVLTYMTFGIAHRLRAMSFFRQSDDMSRADWYLERCLVQFPDMMMQDPSLQLVQALLGVSVLLQTSSRSGRAAMFVSMAMYMVQDLGYHNTGTTSGSVLLRKEQQYVFWIAFFMNTDMCLATMRPSTQLLSDIGISLPDARVEDWWLEDQPDQATVGTDVGIFALHARLAVLQARILEEFFSAKSHQLSHARLRSFCFDALDSLQEWRRLSVVLDASVQDLNNVLYRSDIAHLVILEAAHFRTVYQVRAVYLLGDLTSRRDAFSTSALQAMAESEAPGCCSGAKRLLELSALVPGTDLPTTWISTQATVAALGTLLGSYSRLSKDRTQRLRGEAVSADLQLCERAVERVERAVKQAEKTSVAAAAVVCRELLSQAVDLAHAHDKPEKVAVMVKVDLKH